jgi:hypothetical protein
LIIFSNQEFAAKINVFPFVHNKNHYAKTLDTKPILLIIKDIICSCLIENILPKIKIFNQSKFSMSLLFYFYIKKIN